MPPDLPAVSYRMSLYSRWCKLVSAAPLRKDNACAHAPGWPLARRGHRRQLLLGRLALGTDVALGAHRKHWRERHERVFCGVDTPRRVKVLEEQDLER